MSHLPYHPAPGFGDLMPGFFVVPQNPIHPDRTALVPSVQAATGGVPVAKAKMGDLLPGRFSVPQNPLLLALAQGGAESVETALTGSLAGLGCGSCGGGPACGCGGGANFYGMSGLGAGMVDDMGTWAQEKGMFGLPNVVVFGGLAVAAFMLFSGAPGDSGGERVPYARKFRSYRR